MKQLMAHATDKEKAKEIIKEWFGHPAYEQGEAFTVDHLELQELIISAFAAVRADAVAEERARVIGLHTPEWGWHQKETSQRERVCAFCRGLAWPCPTMQDLSRRP